MESFGILLVACAAYLAGASPIHRVMGLLLQKHCAMCGVKADRFGRTSANILKGCFIVKIVSLVGPIEAQFAAFFLFIGHILPFQNKFKGGNGMALLLGIMIGLDPMLGMVALFSWLFVYFVFRHAGLAAVLSSLVTTTFSQYAGIEVPVILMLVFTMIVVWRHRESILRVMAGQEEMIIWD